MHFSSIEEAQILFESSYIFSQATYALLNEQIPNLYVVKLNAVPYRILIYCSEQEIQSFCHRLSFFRVGRIGPYDTTHIGEFVVKTKNLALTVRPQISSVFLDYTIALSRNARVIAGIKKSFNGQTGYSIGLEWEC